MQAKFDLGMAGEIGRVRDRLCEVFGRLRDAARPPPIDQFVRSFIGSRTRDPVSFRAFGNLVHHFPRWVDLAVAPPAAIERMIFEVTFADVKAERLGPALRLIAADHPDFGLEFLRRRKVAEALAWLERLPGVGRKIASSTLNFSTLDMPAFVVDSHVLRVLQRYGFIGPKVDPTGAQEAVMAAAAGWSGEDLAELHSLLKLLGQAVCTAARL